MAKRMFKIEMGYERKSIDEIFKNFIMVKQAEGIEIAKAKGKYKGRKKIEYPSNWEEVYSKWIKRDITARKAMEELKLKPNTFCNFVAEEKQKSS